MVFGIGTLLGGYGGHWATKNYYQAKEYQSIRQAEKNQEIHRREVEDILEKQEQLEQLVRDLEREANSDPTANTPSLPRRGVQRINRVR